jgi:phage terminase small subunit
VPRKRDPRRDEAFELWKKSNGKKKLKDIAVELKASDSQIRKWKSQDKWDDKLKGNVTNSKRSVTKPKKEQSNKTTNESLPSDDLTDKQRLFCIHYVKSFNATMSAINAGYSSESARQTGSENLSKPYIRDEIKRLKSQMTGDLFLEAMDVLRKYAEIAFADITDYTQFGKKEVQAMGAFGPIQDDEGRPVMKDVNYVDFKESEVVDGTIITEVKQGKDGVSIKLADKMKALDKLAQYFDMLPDQFKRKVEEEKLQLDKEKFALEKAKSQVDDEDYEDDGFIDALNGSAEEVWEDDDQDEE